MTTVAWDGKTLACDSQGDRGGLRHGVPTKIWRLNDGRLFGGCGDWADVLDVLAWLDGDSPRPEGVQDFSGLLISPLGCKILTARLSMHDAPWSFFAIGSGRDFAIAAMHLGCCARDALAVACAYDTYSGGNIHEIAL